MGQSGEIRTVVGTACRIQIAKPADTGLGAATKFVAMLAPGETVYTLKRTIAD